MVAGRPVVLRSRAEMRTQIPASAAAPTPTRSLRCNAIRSWPAKRTAERGAPGIRAWTGPRSSPTAMRRTVASIDTDLRGRRWVAAPALPPVDLTGFTLPQVVFAAAAWPMRAAEELRSALIFRALARAAVAANLPEPWPKRFAAMVVDEIRHARLCADVGSRLGADRPRYDARPVRACLAALPDPIGRTTAILLTEAAMGETISMALF